MNYLEKVNLWKNFKGLDQELALELENLTEKELEDETFENGKSKEMAGAGADPDLAGRLHEHYLWGQPERKQG